MGRVGIPETLWRHIVREAEEKAIAPETVMVELLLKVVPGAEKRNVLVEAARETLRNAEDHASRGEYRDALRKLWATTLLALKAYAMAGNKSLETIADYIGAAVEWGVEALDALSASFTGNTVAEIGVDDSLRKEFYSYCVQRVEKLLEKL